VFLNEILKTLCCLHRCHFTVEMKITDQMSEIFKNVVQNAPISLMRKQILVGCETCATITSVRRVCHVILAIVLSCGAIPGLLLRVVLNDCVGAHL
jgi:hypothetical protein